MELKGFLNSIFTRENETSLSRREALAGLSLVGALIAAPTVIASRPAEAKSLDKAAEAASSKAAPETKDKPGEAQVAEASKPNADPIDATDLSARRHWRRRHWGWRRRHWGWRHRRRWWRRRRRYW